MKLRNIVLACAVVLALAFVKSEKAEAGGYVSISPYGVDIGIGHGYYPRRYVGPYYYYNPYYYRPNYYTPYYGYRGYYYRPYRKHYYGSTYYYPRHGRYYNKRRYYGKAGRYWRGYRGKYRRW